MDLLFLVDNRKDQTAIVMGNGESLNTIPPHLFSKFDSFGTNHIYLCGIQPTYYVCVDTKVLTEYATAIYETASGARVAFLSSLYAASDLPATRRLYALANVCLVSKDALAFQQERYLSGHTGVYVALKMAYYLGFASVLLFGVDHDANWKHCVDDYPPGVPTTDAKKQEMRWHLGYASEVFKSSGRRILNFSLPSQLDSVFERGDLDEWSHPPQEPEGA